jgi:hypothetical protein
MDASLLNPSRFIKSQAFAGREPTLRIKEVRVEELEDNKGAKKLKGIIAFNEIPKEWVLNRTNVECLKAMWGRETDDWIGKRVTLFAAPYHDNTTGEETTCVRVRGSPDIEKTMKVTITLPRKKAFDMTMTKTAEGAKPSSKANGNTNGANGAQKAAAPQPSGEPSEEEKAAIRARELAQAGEDFG